MEAARTAVTCPFYVIVLTDSKDFLTFSVDKDVSRWSFHCELRGSKVGNVENTEPCPKNGAQHAPSCLLLKSLITASLCLDTRAMSSQFLPLHSPLTDWRNLKCGICYRAKCVRNLGGNRQKGMNRPARQEITEQGGDMKQRGLGLRVGEWHARMTDITQGRCVKMF